MSNLNSNYNYPSANLHVTVSGDGGSVGSVNVDNNPERLHNRFILMDNFKEWYAIPRKFVETSVGSGQYHIYIPITTNLNNSYWNLFSRRLFLNTENATAGTGNGLRKFIPINRPAGHKAFLHSVAYASYDFNEMLPKNTSVDKNALIIADMFGTGVAGMRVTSLPVSSLTAGNQFPKSSIFTTAHYPATTDNLQSRTDELAVMEALGQSAPRSSVRGGMLNGDFFMNNFNMNIKGFTAETPDFDDAGEVFANVWETPTDNNSYNISGGKSSSFLPNITNEIDILIPDDVNWLAVDVTGCGWRVGAFEDDLNDSYRHIHKILGSPAGNFITFVQMPVKVQVDIRFWEEPTVTP